MKKQFQIEFVMEVELKNKLGAGPLLTSVYYGTYGPSPQVFSKLKCNQKRILIKEIDARIVSDDVDWSVLQQLDHPNVATYIYVCEQNRLLSSNIFIVQDFYAHTINHLAQLLNYNWLSGQVVKSAVKGIASGLSYLHGHSPDPIVHRNLKPSNVLVKPPLSQPSSFVLTDFWYSNYTQSPKQTSCCCHQPSSTIEDDPKSNILRWMAPELKNNQEVSGTPMMDMYSFGKILEYILSYGPLPFDEVDDYLFKLLIQETVRLKPSSRIKSVDILDYHPLLLELHQSDVKDIAKARLRYIKLGYGRIKLELSSGKNKLRNELDSMACCIAGNKIIPWNVTEDSTDSFNHRIFIEMSRISKKTFDPTSLLDLLRLIRNSGKFLSMDSDKSTQLLSEIDKDTLSRSYPYVIPLVYISLDCGIDPALLPPTNVLENNTVTADKFQYPAKLSSSS